MDWIEEPRPRYVRTNDGSYLNSAHVYRWFVTEDVTQSSFAIKASVIGAQQPFTARVCESREEANEDLAEIIRQLGI